MQPASGATEFNFRPLQYFRATKYTEWPFHGTAAAAAIQPPPAWIEMGR
jgi:hypothetical protein